VSIELLGAEDDTAEEPDDAFNEDELEESVKELIEREPGVGGAMIELLIPMLLGLEFEEEIGFESEESPGLGLDGSLGLELEDILGLDIADIIEL
jgi:hypothetical protein